MSLNNSFNYNFSKSLMPILNTISNKENLMPNIKLITTTTLTLLDKNLTKFYYLNDSSLLDNISNVNINNLADLTIINNNNIINNTNTNHTIIKLEHAPQLSKASIIRCIVLSLMAIISLLGNIATMWNIYKTRMSRRTSRHSWSAIYSLIFHLSIADLLVTGFCIIGEAAWFYTVKWLAGDLACKLFKFFQMFSLYLSTYVLVLIGIDRWIAVKYPMKSLNMSQRCYRLLAGAYILSFLFSLPQLLIFRVARGPFVEEFYQCVTHGFYTASWQEPLYNTFTLFFTFIIPLCILFVSYVSTFRTISGSEKMFQGSKLTIYTNKPTQTNRQRIIHKAKMKSLRISVVIIVAFLICWTPYNVMMIIFTFSNPDKRLGEDLQSGIFFFGMSNSLVNPLIYGAFHLCPPMKRNNSQYNQYCLTRENSQSCQRSPSLMTATTQIDLNGRHTFNKRSSYNNRNNSSLRNNNNFNLNHIASKQVNKQIIKNISENSSEQNEYLLKQTTSKINDKNLINHHNNHQSGTDSNKQTTGPQFILNFSQNGINERRIDISSV